MMHSILEKINHKRVPIVFFLIILISFFLRIRDIYSFPINFDESVHGYYSYYLLKTGIYQFESFSHGPFLFYTTALAFGLFGDSIIIGRFVSVFFGTATILAIYPLRKWLGDAGLIVTSALFAISPFFITFAQELRNDNFLIFFTLIMVVSIILYLDTRKELYFFLASASFALALTVKENIILILFVFLSYFLFLSIFSQNYLKEICLLSDIKNANILDEVQIRAKESYRMLLISFIIIISIYTLFYTSFFTNWAGFLEGMKSPIQWFKITLDPDPEIVKINNFVYRNDPLEYIKLLWRYEMIPQLLGLAGGVYAFIKKDKFMQFLFYWALILLFIYSILKYKQPQHVLNFLLPLLILSGVLIDRIFKSVNANRKKMFLIVLFISFIGTVYVSSDALNKMKPIHNAPGISLSEFKTLGQSINELSSGNNEKYVLIYSINNDSTQTFFPLLWYLREYSVNKRMIFANVNYMKNISYDVSIVENGLIIFKEPLILVPDNIAGNLYIILKDEGYVEFNTGAYVQNLGSKRELLMFYPAKYKNNSGK